MGNYLLVSYKVYYIYKLQVTGNLLYKVPKTGKFIYNFVVNIYLLFVKFIYNMYINILMVDKEFYKRHINVCKRNIQNYEHFYNFEYNPYKDVELLEYNEYFDCNNIYGYCYWVHNIILNLQNEIIKARKSIKSIKSL